MEQWAKVEAGVQQRVHTLEKFLADVYDAGHGRHQPRTEPAHVEIHATPQDVGPALDSFSSQHDQQQQQAAIGEGSTSDRSGPGDHVNGTSTHESPAPTC